MSWNWQDPNWPNFQWDDHQFGHAESLFAQEGGVIVGMSSALGEDEVNELKVKSLTEEADETSRIEGELLDRDSVQASVRRYLGLSFERRSGPSESGVAEMMVDVCEHLTRPFREEDLFRWHEMLMNGRRDVEVGRYRTHEDPMQIVSGRYGDPRVHFEAPPSKQVQAEMDHFLEWVDRTGPGQSGAPGALQRAGVAHLWFESIHPFEDGNGRIGRVISEKLLAQTLEASFLTGLSTVVSRRKNEYYDELAKANQHLHINQWLQWFAAVAIEARRTVRAHTELVIKKAKLFSRLGDELNDRQKAALLRMFEAGPSGFEGGLSAKNYMSITKATQPTTTRDLSELVDLGALSREGQRRHTRYYLNVDLKPVIRPAIDELFPG